MSKGVPFDVAFALDETTRTAWFVIVGEHEGGKFNWRTGEWERP